MSNYFDNKKDFLEPRVTQYGSSMVMTNVNKPRKTKYLNIDTRFTDEYWKKSNNSSDQNHTITLPERLNEIKSLTVSQIEIPIPFDNVSLKFGNSTFTVQNQTTQETKNIVLPDGYYSNDTHTALKNLPIELKMTANSRNLTKISNLSTSVVYKVNFATDGSGNFDKYYLKSKLGWLLGFRKDTYTIGPNEELVSESVIDCCPNRYMYLVLDEFSNSSPNSFMSFLTHSTLNKKIIAKISFENSTSKRLLIGNEKNGVLISDIRTYTGTVDIQRLNVQLINEWGRTIELNGLDFSFLLKIEHE